MYLVVNVNQLAMRCSWVRHEKHTGHTTKGGSVGYSRIGASGRVVSQNCA